MFKILRPIDGPFLNHLDQFARVLGLVNAPADYTQTGKVVTIYFNRNNWKNIIKFATLFDEQLKVQYKKYQLKFGQEGLKGTFLNAPFEKRLVLPSWKRTSLEKSLSIRYGVCNSMLGYSVKIYELRHGKYSDKAIFIQEDDRKVSFPKKLQVPKELMELAL